MSYLPLRSQLHDHIQGNTSWPDVYDGRAIVTPTYEDYAAGVPLDENTKRFKAAKEEGDLSRMVTWSCVNPFSYVSYVCLGISVVIGY